MHFLRCSASYIDAIRFQSEVPRPGDARLAAAQLASEEATRFAARHPDLDAALGYQGPGRIHACRGGLGPPGSLPHWQKAAPSTTPCWRDGPDGIRGTSGNAALVEKNVGGFYETSRDYAAAPAASPPRRWAWISGALRPRAC
jgi:hypothetical protein